MLTVLLQKLMKSHLILQIKVLRRSVEVTVYKADVQGKWIFDLSFMRTVVLN